MKTGFTLIEVMVVVSIMGVLMTVGIASYNKLNDRVKIEEAARSIESQLRSWQKQADSGVGSQVCVTAFEGIRVTTSSTSVASTIVCGGVDSTTPEVFEVPNGATITGTTSFTMKPLGGGVSAAQAIVVRNSANSIRYQVVISTAGGISVAKL